MRQNLNSLYKSFYDITQDTITNQDTEMKTLSLASLALLAISLLSSCDKRPDQADIVVLYTTDVHGAYLPYDIRNDKPASTSMANVCSYVKQQRQEFPSSVLLFDTGDCLQGQPSMYYYNFVDTLSPHLVPLVYNYVGYDAIGLGNHDVETGERLYHKRLPAQFHMPWLCANAIDERTGKPMFKPYHVFERQGFKVAVLGMITPNIAAWLPKKLWPHLEFQDMVECASHWVPIIQKNEKPDILVGLFHAGTDYQVNGNTIDTPMNENGSIPAATRVPGFDLILCGHDHQGNMFSIANVNGDSIHVIDAQTGAAKVGRAVIHLAKDKQTGKYHKTIRTDLADMTQYEPDKDYCETFEYAVKEVNDYVDSPIGYLAATLYGEPSLYGPSEFMDFIHDVQLSATGADVSFAAVLAAHDSVPAGPITMRQLFTLYRYENMLVTLKMTGEEVEKYLNYGLSHQFNGMNDKDDHLLAFMFDDQGNIMTNVYGPRFLTPSFNFTSAAGIRYEVHLDKPRGEQLQILSMSDGSAFDRTKTYKVALNSYQASGGGNFVPEGLGWSKQHLDEQVIEWSDKDVRQYVADYIQEHDTIVPHLRDEWRLTPEEWWKRGCAKDKEFINPNQR